MKKHIVENQITCKLCGDTIRSTTVHDFKMCVCGLVGVDGGREYLKRTGKESDYIEESTFTMGMTYRELKEELNKLTEEQLDCDAMVYEVNYREIYPTTLEVIKDDNDKFLDKGQCYLRISPEGE